MKRLTEFLADDSDPNQLDEGLLSSALKTTYILAQASTSKKYGDEVVRHSTEAIRALSKPIAAEHPNPVNLRLDKIEKALISLARSQIAQRKQIGNGIAVATASALISDRVAKQINQQKRR